MAWKREIRFECQRLDDHALGLESKRVVWRHRSDGATYSVMVVAGGQFDNQEWIDSRFQMFDNEPLHTPPLDDDDFQKLVKNHAQELGTTLYF